MWCLSRSGISTIGQRSWPKSIINNFERYREIPDESSDDIGKQSTILRVLVTGSAGMLGSDVVTELDGRGHITITPSLEQFDITDPASAAKIASESWGKLDWLVNCAAYTAVDKAESESDLAIL